MSASCWQPAGSWSDQSVSWRAHDSGSVPAASAAAISGWACRSFIRAAWTVAARRVARVCQVSHVRGDRCPSPARPPPGTRTPPAPWRARRRAATRRRPGPAGSRPASRRASPRGRRGPGSPARPAGTPAPPPARQPSSRGGRGGAAGRGKCRRPVPLGVGLLAAVPAAAGMELAAATAVAARAGKPGPAAANPSSARGGGAGRVTPGMAQPGSVITRLPPADIAVSTIESGSSFNR